MIQRNRITTQLQTTPALTYSLKKITFRTLNKTIRSQSSVNQQLGAIAGPIERVTEERK